MFKKNLCNLFICIYIVNQRQKAKSKIYKNSFTKKPLEFELQNILRNDKKKKNPKTDKLLN